MQLAQVNLESNGHLNSLMEAQKQLNEAQSEKQKLIDAI
jgi:hypothetical protein